MKLQQTIGILGGGQLARMTIAAAMQYGIRVKVLDKSADAPAAQYASEFTEGNPQDQAVAVAFAAGCDAVTIDSEHVSAAALSELAQQGVRVFPSGAALATIQNKCRQKEFFAAHKIPTARFRVVPSLDALRAQPPEFPAIQKKATAGYDGQGVMLLATEADLARAFDGESLLEERVAIAKEIAVIVATDLQGQRVTYDPVEMVFDGVRNILKYQICPADISEDQARHARAIALLAAEKLGIRGLLAVEMFINTAGEILVNEMAPRPHNSGHHTIEAAATSQYENLVRILTGMPLGDAATTTPSLMMNLLGPENGREAEFSAIISRALRMPYVHVHLYGKKDIRPYRKLGHITLTGEADQILVTYRQLTGGEQ